MQEAYVRFLTFEAKPGSTVTNAGGLLRRISLNLVRDHLRRAGRVPMVELTETIPCPQPGRPLIACVRPSVAEGGCR